MQKNLCEEQIIFKNNPVNIIFLFFLLIYKQSNLANFSKAENFAKYFSGWEGSTRILGQSSPSFQVECKYI